MRRTFKVRFYCRKSKIRKDGTAPVEASIIVDGSREIFSLPRSCNPSEFPTQDLALYLDGVRNKINGIYTALSIADEPITAFILKDIFLNGARKVSYTLKNMFDDGLKLKAAENRGLVAYSKYEVAVRHFYEILKLNPNKEAGSVTHSDILTLMAGFRNIHKPQTIEKEMMRIKYFFLLAFNSGKIKSNPFAAIRIRRPEPENIFLTEEELERLINADILDDKYDRARDLLVFMAGTGLEYADLWTLKPDSVQTYRNLHYIKGKRVKTGAEYVTVVQDFALEIWNFYGGKLPKLSNQKLNKYSKECQKIAKIDKNLTTLVMRHTFGTQALNRGLSIDIVSKMLGHLNTKQTRTYASLIDTTVLDANETVKNSEIGNLSSKMIEARTAKISGQEWDDTLDWFRAELGLN